MKLGRVGIPSKNRPRQASAVLASLPLPDPREAGLAQAHQSFTMGPSLRPMKSAVPQPRKGSEEYKTGWRLCLEVDVAKGEEGKDPTRENHSVISFLHQQGTPAKLVYLGGESGIFLDCPFHSHSPILLQPLVHKVTGPKLRHLPHILVPPLTIHPTL